MSEEEWRICPGYSQYEVSSHGNVRRLVRGNAYKAGYVRKPYPGKFGHLNLYMNSDDGRRPSCPVSRLVLWTFVGPAPSVKHEAAHWDGNSANNTIGNLRWATHAENEADKLRHATSNRGNERSGNRRLTEEQVQDIRRRYIAGESQGALAKQFGVSRSGILSVTLKLSWNWLPWPVVTPPSTWDSRRAPL